jgi:hypothetical protein
VLHEAHEVAALEDEISARRQRPVANFARTKRRRSDVKVSVKTLSAAIAVCAALVFPASAAAKTGAVNWVCNVPGEGDVTFVSAPLAARNGIERANQTAGSAFLRQFGELCRVEVNSP